MKIPINIGESHHSLLETLKIASFIYNKHSAFGFKEKCWSKNVMHKKLYRDIRLKHQEFPSALVQTVRDNACESLKSMNSNKKWKSQPVKRPFGSLRYDKRTCTINLAKKKASLSWIGQGRCNTTFEIPKYYGKYLTWDIRGVHLVYRNHKFFLYISVQLPDPPFQCGATLGIDKGINTFLFCSDGTSVKGNGIWGKREYFQQRRKELQSLGTRSAIRKLRKLSGREKRFVTDCLHCIVNDLLKKPFATYAVEDLTHIRVRSRKGKEFNRRISNWVYSKFDKILEYKSTQHGKRTVKVDPRYTSQKCSACGHIERSNRSQQKFKCKVCCFETHSDYNASINILTVAVNQPMVSHVEAKAS